MIKTIDNKKIVTKKIKYDNNSFKYTNEEYDITIIEMNVGKNDNYKFLELDENIFTDNIGYVGESIYTLHYPSNFGKDKVAVSLGILKNIDNKKKYNFAHYCSTEFGSSGGPILNLSNNKVIGLHKSASKNKQYNMGIFLNYPLEEFINKYKYKDKKSCEKNNSNNYKSKYSQKKNKKEYNKKESDITDYKTKNENKHQIIKKNSEKNFENNNNEKEKKDNIFSKKYKNNCNDIEKPENKIYKNSSENQIEPSNYEIPTEQKLEKILEYVGYDEERKLIKQLFYNLYDEGLVSDVKQISIYDEYKYDIVAIIFQCRERVYWTSETETWISAFHGTKFDYIESILKYGLKIPQTLLENGTLTPKPIDIPLIDKIFGIKNWENAIFASPNLFYALDSRYSGTVLKINKDLDDDNSKIGKDYASKITLRVILLVKIRPDSFTKHKSKIIAKFHKHHCFFENNDFDIKDIYRVSNENDIVVSSVIFMRHLINKLSDSEMMELSEKIFSLIKD